MDREQVRSQENRVLPSMTGRPRCLPAFAAVILVTSTGLWHVSCSKKHSGKSATSDSGDNSGNGGTDPNTPNPSTNDGTGDTDNPSDPSTGGSNTGPDGSNTDPGTDPDGSNTGSGDGTGGTGGTGTGSGGTGGGSGDGNGDEGDASYCWSPDPCGATQCGRGECNVWCHCANASDVCSPGNVCEQLTATATSCSSCTLQLQVVDYEVTSVSGSGAGPPAGLVSKVTLAVLYRPINRTNGHSEPLARLADVRIRVSRDVIVEQLDLGQASISAQKELYKDPKTKTSWQRKDSDDAPPEFRFLVGARDNVYDIPEGTLFKVTFSLKDPGSIAFWLSPAPQILAPKGANDALMVDTGSQAYTNPVVINNEAS